MSSLAINAALSTTFLVKDSGAGRFHAPVGGRRKPKLHRRSEWIALLESEPSRDQNSFFHLRTTIFVPRPASVSMLNSSTSRLVPDRPSPNDFAVLKPPASARFKICNSRSMICKFKFQADSACHCARTAIRAMPFLCVNPDVPAEFGGGGRQRGHRELIEADVLCEFPDALAHGDDVRFFIDPDFPVFGVSL